MTLESFNLSCSSSLSFFRTSNASKVVSLYEVSYLAEFDKVSVTNLPLVNPCLEYIKPRHSFSKSTHTLISSSKSQIKEYVQASKFDQHLLRATEKEQFVTLELPSHLPKVWLTKWFKHIHYGAVRFALTLHRRKELPAVSRIVLLDTRFAYYQCGCIGTVHTTLNAGTILVRMFLNFNMLVSDPQLLSALKIQVQIVGAIPSIVTYAATLHYQMIYRVENHSLEFATLQALMMPSSSRWKQINQLHLCSETDPESELLKLIPKTWFTGYEQHHQASQNSKPIQSSTHYFRKKI
ncbi:putative viral movement protein [Abeliophyllum distichum]|uniref:Viral movement protein n=1 Tax=Abeliophyllum distichum TaxID=126358 RepID=A0ABD1PSU9_9LAMI